MCLAAHDLASKFLNFFADKISGIRLKLISSFALDKFRYPNCTPPIMDYFLPTTVGEVRTLIFSSPNKTGLLDTIPTWFLKECFDVLGPTITSIKLINSFALDKFRYPNCTPPIMDYFLPTTVGEVRTLIFSSPNKTGLLDTIPTWFLKECFDVLGPTITSIKLINSFALDKFLYPNCTPPIMDYFLPTTVGEVRTLIFSSPNKTSLLDTIPTWFLKECFDVLGPTITTIINFSLHEGSFPSTFAHAIVHPLLKKPSLDPDDLSNYRPISTLNFISKILERIVLNRMQTHLSSNSLISPFQS